MFLKGTEKREADQGTRHCTGCAAKLTTEMTRAEDFWKASTHQGLRGGGLWQGTVSGLSLCVCALGSGWLCAAPGAPAGSAGLWPLHKTAVGDPPEQNMV